MKMYNVIIYQNDDGDPVLCQSNIGEPDSTIVISREQIPTLIKWLRNWPVPTEEENESA